MGSIYLFILGILTITSCSYGFPNANPQGGDGGAQVSPGQQTGRSMPSLPTIPPAIQAVILQILKTPAAKKVIKSLKDPESRQKVIEHVKTLMTLENLQELLNAPIVQKLLDNAQVKAIFGSDTLKGYAETLKSYLPLIIQLLENIK